MGVYCLLSGSLNIIDTRFFELMLQFGDTTAVVDFPIPPLQDKN